MDRNQSIISLAAVVAVYICSQLGIVLEEDAAVQVFTAIAGLCAVLWGCWKNHNFTSAAQWAQRQLDEFKSITDKRGL